MKYKLYFFLIFLMSPSFFSQNYTKALSERNANYDISVVLDPINKTLSGEQVLRWENITNTPVDELQFHLYLNAFKNSRSTFMQESRMRHRGFSSDENDSLSWGWIDIDSFVIEEGEDISSSIEYIQPDDNNAFDQTVVRIPLQKKIKPNETIEVKIKFTAKLPKIMARTGYSDDYFLVGQWFPKIGVFEAVGQRGRESAGWNCHQFHANSEFYADFGIYNVDITLPQEFVVGATGLLENEINNNDGTKTLNYKAEDVLDFAWTASPLFEVIFDKYKDIEIKVLLQPQHLAQADRHTMSLKNALEYFEKHLGEFPYPSITVVDPPFRGLASAGMEYPMFITAGCIWGMPEGFKTTEMVTIHELGHNYFMGIIASNEFEEAWLDEGMNSYFENKIMDFYYGDKTSMVDILGFKSGDLENSRISFAKMRNPYVGEINRYSWLYTNGGYGTMSYSKASVVLQTLENIIGSETMDEIMKTYYDRWKFKHPGTQDFIDIVNEIVKKQNNEIIGENINSFFDQLLNTTDICDYKVASIGTYRLQGQYGIVEEEDSKKLLEPKKNDDFETKAIITRIGEIKLPQEILIHFDDGSEILEKWDGQDRLKTFSYTGDKAIEWVKIDPENKILVDINLANNSLTIDRKTGVVWKYATKMMFWVQNTMLSMFF